MTRVTTTLRRRPLAFVVGVWLLASTPPGWAQTAASSSPASSALAGEPGISGTELDAMIAPLGADPVDVRRAAAAAIASLGAGATPAIAKRLADLRKTGDGGTYSAVKAARERAAGGSFDLLEALVTQRPEASVTRALTTVSLLRALAHAGTTPAVRQLVLIASDAGGVLRPELGRQLKQLGDRAVAGLIEARRDPSPETRTWASNLLDGLAKRTPGDAVQTKDNQALSDILRAYANIKDLDALPVVLSFVNSDRVQVRSAAREATLAYGQDAQWKLREAYAALSGEPAPDGIAAADLAKKLFDAYDRFRLHDVYALLEKGLAAHKEGRLKDAISAFDEALARQPMLDRRAEAVPAYVAYGESLEDSDRGAALAYLRKALRLDEAGATSSHVRSDVATLEGEDLVARGIADSEPFETALSLDPANSRALADLERIRAQLQSSNTQTWRLVAAGIVLALALAGIAVIGGRRRPRPATTSEGDGE
jgi:tetratricopeptide (TPR) repeat protein